jgi:flagellar biosynthetic protein FliP
MKSARSQPVRNILATLAVLCSIALSEVRAQQYSDGVSAPRPLTTAPFENPYVSRHHEPRSPRVNSLRLNADDPTPAVVGASAVDVPSRPTESPAPAAESRQVQTIANPTGTSSETANTEQPLAPADVPQELPKQLAADETSNLLPAGPSTGPATLPLAIPESWGGPEKWLSPEGISSALETLGMLAVVSLAPAILLMTTCFVRITVVLGLLRQALGTQQLPPNQVMTSIALFMTLLIMMPVWNRVYSDGIKPYAAKEISATEAWDAGIKPVRQFMSAQIDRTGNRDDVWLFYKYLPQDTPEPSSYDEVPLTVLLPAFMLSELKTAFLIGFQIYLPFLVLDLVVSSVTISMGMMMLPPVMISLPFKLLLFVLVDGWHLVVGMLLDSFQPFS